MAVIRNANRVVFSDRYDGTQLRKALGSIYHAVAHLNYGEVMLDFSRCTHAFESGVLPLIPIIRNYIARFKVDFILIPPKDTHANSLFYNSGWDHFIDPKRFLNRSSHDARHVPVMQFRNSQEQNAAVDSLIQHFTRNSELSKDQLQAIEWSLNEITDNVINHANSPVGGFVQSCLFRDRKAIEFLVADGGIGIPRSLDIKDPKLALEKAIQEGVTRNKKTNQGNGLYGVFRIALVANGQFNLQSYLGNMVVHSGSISFRSETAPYNGTYARWSISLDAKNIISQALVINGRQHTIGFDYFDSITDPDRDCVTIKLKDKFISLIQEKLAEKPI